MGKRIGNPRVLGIAIGVALLATIGGCTNPVSPGQADTGADAGTPPAPDPGTPTMSPAPGTYDADLTVSLSSTLAGAAIYYTTDGSPPSDASNLFDPGTPIDVAGDGASVTIRSIAIGADATASPESSGTYTIDYAQLAAPAVTGPSTPYPSGTTFALSTSKPSGVEYYFTTDGSPPTFDPTQIDPNTDSLHVTSGTTSAIWQYEGITLTTPDTGPTTYTVRVVAYADGFKTSPETQVDLTVEPGRVVSTISGTGTGSLLDALSQVPAGGTIGFGADGTIYTGAIGPPTNQLAFAYSISEDVTIDGGGHDVTIDSGLGDRHFVIGGGATVTIRNLRLWRGTRNDGSDGGGIYVGPGSTLILENVVMDENGTGNGLINGGAVFNDGGTLIVRGSRFSDNWAGANRGAIAVTNGGAVTVRDSSFAGNVSHDVDSDTTSAGGGALWVEDGGTATIIRSLFAENVAETSASYSARNGGAIRADGTVTVHESLFTANEADGDGGVFSISSTGSVTAVNSVFANNVAAAYFGSFRFDVAYAPDASSEFIVVGCSFLNDPTDDRTSITNSAFSSGSLVYGRGSFASNMGVRDWTGSAIPGSGLNDVAAFRRAPDPGPDGVWGTDDDDWGDMRLVAGSPGIDAGSNAAVAVDTADVDEDGNSAEDEADYARGARIAGGTVDIGAVEQ